MKKETMKKESGWQILGKTWRAISIGISVLMSLFFIFIFFSLAGALIPEESLETGNIAVIPLNGIISTETVGFGQMVNSQDIVKLIEKAEEADDIEAIILEINSPGGTPVATDEIAQAVKKAEKPVVAVIRETGASGAYWIATAADKIYANRMSITGSIGVKASRLEFSGLIADYNITYRQLTAGKYKDSGSPFKKMTAEEQALYQDILDNLHEEFITVVAENRHLPKEKVRTLATGFVFLGSEAKELGLVDELGGKQDALDYLGKELNITAEPVTYKKQTTFVEALSGMTTSMSTNIGKGIGSTLISDTEVSFT